MGSEIIKRIESMCNDFDSRVIEVGLPVARLELVKALVEAQDDTEKCGFMEVKLILNSEEAYYKFLNFLWVEFQNGSDKRLGDLVDALCAKYGEE